ncbi:MAG: c-type cytochrome [Ruminococcaceae bacterium]|nr:c-type cytochrome [Oscillospiraceae bacterium]
MIKSQKLRVLLCVFAIIAAISLVMIGVSLWNRGKNSNLLPDGYTRLDVSGTQIGATVSNGVTGDLSSYTSISGVTTLGESLYVADETGKNVYKLSQNGKVQKKYTSERQINNIVSDGNNLYVLEGALDGRVVKLSANLDVLASAEVGHTPSDIAVVSGKGYVVNRFSATVSVVDLSDMKVDSDIKIDGREPIAAASVGTDVYVACHLPDEASGTDVMSANINIISSKTNAVTKTIPMVNGSSGVKDICVDPAGDRIYISHIVGRYAYPTTQLDRAWINSNCFSILDVSTKEILCSVLLDEVDEGAANPWGVTVSSDGKKLCVALSGLNEIMVVDISGMNSKINNVRNNKSGALVDDLSDIVDYLPFLNGDRERITVGVGVRAVTEKNGVLYCGNYFDGTLTAVNLSNLKTNTISFVDQPKASRVRMGQILWSDANNCYQRWQSCNSCHPDAVVDGFNWDNLNDGIGGGGKSARSMLYSHRTPPVMSTGIRPSAEVAVAAGMKFIQFNTLSADSLAMIDEYLKTLYPQSSPSLNKDGTLTESASAGKALFEKNCASCHPAPLYTNNKLYNVGSKHFDGDSGIYDVPTLNEVWRTAPYMHDGSLNTIEEVVRFFADDLTDDEVKQLADFVRSIGAEGETYGVEQVHFTADDGSTFYNQYKAGAEMNKVVVRRQSQNAEAIVTVAISVFDKDGKQVFYSDVGVSNLAYNSSAVITLDDGMILPEGGSYTICFYGRGGKPVASALTFAAEDN